MKRYTHKRIKAIAMKDITEAYVKNYVIREYKVLEFAPYDFQYIQI